MDYALSLTLGLTGVIFVITAMISRRFPPKNINHFYGYRTKASMKNQERWDFAQDFSMVKMKNTGYVMILLAVLFLIFDLDFIGAPWQVFFSICILLGCCVYLIFTTEKALKEKFGKK
ncbi:MAG: hypothetical protein CL868_02725 [Cytophagaceae bacterium]|nr:hypothetical protein [Cytophagaceae bacterium]|tara:strand:+ start:3098 stop:3451 length:354 start_codon:yes stop_codon:yes gene_type:complete